MSNNRNGRITAKLDQPAVTGETTKLVKDTPKEEPSPEVLELVKDFESYQRYQRRLRFMYSVVYPCLTVIVICFLLLMIVWNFGG